MIRYLAAIVAWLWLAACPVMADGVLEGQLIGRPAVGDQIVYGPMQTRRFISVPELPGRSAMRIGVATPGVAEVDLEANRAGLTLSLNTRAQVVEIGPIYLFANAQQQDMSVAPLKAVPVGGAVDATIDTPGGVRIAATLRTPPGEGPFPAALQITGHGPWGRNPADPVALALLNSGVAMLQFDKRGVGESTGRFDAAEYADLRDDAAVLAKWLRQQPGIDARRTGVLGGSEGGMIAVSIAAMDPEVAFVISMAGPAQSAADRMVSVNALAMREQGVPQKTIDAISQMSREGVAALAMATSDDDAAARVTATLKPYVGKLITQAEADQMVAMARDPVARARMLSDPKSELERIRVPVLGLFGSLDLQVPADENAAAMRAGLKDNPDVTVVIMPGFNHLFQHARTGTVDEWSTLKEVGGSDPELLRIITEWVAKRTALKAQGQK